MPQQRVPLLEALNKIASDLQKSASDTADGGPTTHPVKGLDNGTVPLKEGERSAENVSDIKDQVPGDNVETAPSQTPDANTLATVQSTGGLKAKPTGESPGEEDNYGSNISDPGTAMPASVDKKNEKYSSLSFDENIKQASDLGNAILASILQPGTKAAAAATTPITTPAVPAAPTGFDKDATINTEEIVAGTIKDACAHADLLGYYLTMQKQAEDAPAPPPEEPPVAPEAPPAGGGGGSPAEMGQPPMAEGTGAMPPDAGAGAGAPPPGMPPAGDPGMGGMGGGPSQDEALQQLVAGLQEMGITPEMLMAAAQSSTPDAGGDMTAKQAFVASTALGFMRSGKYRQAEPKSAAERVLRDNAKNYVKQIFKI